MLQALYGACERGFKPLVKGRKTSLFFQNLMGAWRASMMYSFFETCAMNHLNPQQWLTYVLNNIKTTPEDQLTSCRTCCRITLTRVF